MRVLLAHLLLSQDLINQTYMIIFIQSGLVLALPLRKLLLHLLLRTLHQHVALGHQLDVIARFLECLLFLLPESIAFAVDFVMQFSLLLVPLHLQQQKFGILEKILPMDGVSEEICPIVKQCLVRRVDAPCLTLLAFKL